MKNDTVIFQKNYRDYTPDTKVYVASAGKWVAAAVIGAVVDRTDLVQNVVRQFGLYLLWAQEICGDPTLVREDRVGQTPGASVVPPGAQPSS